MEAERSRFHRDLEAERRAGESSAAAREDAQERVRRLREDAEERRRLIAREVQGYLAPETKSESKSETKPSAQPEGNPPPPPTIATSAEPALARKPEGDLLDPARHVPWQTHDERRYVLWIMIGIFAVALIVASVLFFQN